MHRVQELAKRSPEEVTAARDVFVKSAFDRPAFVMLVPLMEILAEVEGSGVSSQNVEIEYNRLTEKFGSEFEVLMKTSVEEITKVAGEKVAEGILRVRQGEVFVDPGYDGVFGTVRIWGEKEKEPEKQMSLF
jgi:PHP family Zn ribbon phosphoesterase